MKAASLIFRPANAPATRTANAAVQHGAADLVRLFALDRLPARRRLICHWHHDADGRLIAVWEPDLGGCTRR